MSRLVIATFEDGVLKPRQELDLRSGTTVQIVVLPYQEAQAQTGFAELDRFRAQHPVHSRGRRLTRDQLHERP